MYNALYYAFNDNAQAEEDNIQTAEMCNTRQRPEQRGELRSRVTNEGQTRMIN